MVAGRRDRSPRGRGRRARRQRALRAARRDRAWSTTPTRIAPRSIGRRRRSAARRLAARTRRAVGDPVRRRRAGHSRSRWPRPPPPRSFDAAAARTGERRDRAVVGRLADRARRSGPGSPPRARTTRRSRARRRSLPSTPQRRDFRSLFPTLQLGWLPSETVDLTFTAGWRWLVFKSDRDFDFPAPTAAVDLRWARQQAAGPDWELGAGVALEHRAVRRPGARRRLPAHRPPLPGPGRARSTTSSWGTSR